MPPDQINPQDLAGMQKQIDELGEIVKALSGDYYSNNFPSSQDFQKYVRFNGRLKVPHYAANPTVGDIGEVIEVGGKFKICTVASLTAPTWTVVGTQT